MNLQERKTKLVEEYNQTNQTVLRLQQRQQQILGQLQLLEEFEREPKVEEKPKAKK